jgi:hypothetical protein
MSGDPKLDTQPDPNDRSNAFGIDRAEPEAANTHPNASEDAEEEAERLGNFA